MRSLLCCSSGLWLDSEAVVLLTLDSPDVGPCAVGQVAADPFTKRWAPALLRACRAALWQGKRVGFTECFM